MANVDEKFCNESIDKLLKSVGADVKFKNESKVMKLVGKFYGLFNKRFMTDYINVFFRTIWFPTREHYEKSGRHHLLALITHECSHVSSFNKYHTIGMVLSYGFPQCIAIFSVPATIILAAIGFFSLEGNVRMIALASSLVLLIASVVSLLPWPAYMRIKEETKAEASETYMREAIGLKEDSEKLLVNATSMDYYNPNFPLEKARKIYAETLTDLRKKLDDEGSKKNNFEKTLVEVAKSARNA